MRVKVALAIGKPLRRGSFIARSDSIRTWVSFKYERLPLFCHFCGMMGHDVKHCASHFALTQNGGEVEFQYGESLHAMGGRPRSFSPRKTGASADAVRGQQFRESSCNSLKEKISPVAGLGTSNPSRPVEIDSVKLGVAPNFQGANNVERESNAYVQHEVSTGLVPDSALQNNVVDQPAGLGLFNVAVGGLVDNITGPVYNNLGREGR